MEKSALVRITPADAGKTDGFLEEIRPVEDHPRGCGENFCLRSWRRCYKGSPPRMRGKLSADINRNDEIRITPADAGKTVQPSIGLFYK